MWHLQRIFLLTAWGILFAHSIVPHNHEDQLELEICTTEQHNADFLDFLGHIFQFSTGEDHLEEYNPGGQSLTFYVPDGISPLPALLVVDKPSSLSEVEVYPKKLFKDQPLRAPPVYS